MITEQTSIPLLLEDAVSLAWDDRAYSGVEVSYFLAPGVPAQFKLAHRSVKHVLFSILCNAFRVRALGTLLVTNNIYSSPTPAT
jgi:hypothetical protein